jgi:FkbH-like protein
MTASTLMSLDFMPVVASHVLDVIGAARGSAKKCLVLDLDNTLWGGVIGDDGLESIEIGDLGLGPAHSEVQRWAKELSRRGVILAVSSKNDPAVAKEPFERHPDMVLRLPDIAVFSANWETKVDNIKHIQSILEIGFDAMVFLDDNPAEREIVRTNLPEVTVPELPEDVVEWLPFLHGLNLFETASVSAEDADRTAHYREEGERRVFQKSFANEEEFLVSLGMTGRVEGLTPFNLPRVAQLTQRSNQFNLRTVRYTEADLKRFAELPGNVPLAFSLDDKFGSYGLVSVVLAAGRPEGLFLDTWLMSCRVLKRGLEALVLNAIVAAAKGAGHRLVIGEYLPTKKNGLVKDHYESLGFRREGALWYLDVAGFEPRRHFIGG